MTDPELYMTRAEKRARQERERRNRRAMKQRESMTPEEKRAEEERLEREIKFRLITGRVTKCPSPWSNNGA